MVVYDLDGTFIEANHAMVAWSRLSREELAEISFDDLLGSTDPQLILNELGAARAGTTRRFTTAGTIGKEVAYRAQVTLFPVLEAQVPRAVAAIVHDLDLGEESLRSDRVMVQTFGDYLTTMPEALILVRHDWVVIFMNPSAVSMLGTGRDDVIGNLLWDGVPRLQGSEFGIAARSAMVTRESQVVRDYDTAFGAWREARFHPTTEGLAIYIRDVSLEHRSLDRAATVEAQVAAQAALLDIAHDVIYVRGLDNVVSYWNRAAAETFGISADELIGVDIRTLINDVEAWDRATSRALKDGQWSGRLQQRARDGRLVTLDCRWTLVRDDEGQPQSILAVNSDITERGKQEEQLLRAQRMDSLGTLASGIAHDLNNVLTPILLSTQVLLATETDPGRTELLTTIESGTRRGAALLAQILTFGRGVEGSRAPVDTAQLLTSVEKFCRDVLPADIELSVAWSSDVWAPIGDETQLFQVLVNLVINARDAMPTGGELNMRATNVSVSPSGRYVLIEVEDTGTGMSAETISKVFEPFFTTKAVGEGTGLGLSTSIEIVRGHGGQLQVYSEPGNGSRFTLQLPADDPLPSVEPVAIASAAVTATVPRGRGQVALVVDDEAAIRTAARHALEGSGYIAAVASNGAEALQYIESVGGSVDVVITDVTMPVMDGAELIQRLRTEHPRMPIVAASGLAANSRVVEGWPPPPITFIVKPYETVDLLRAVHDALEPDEVETPADG